MPMASCYRIDVSITSSGRTDISLAALRSIIFACTSTSVSCRTVAFLCDQSTMLAGSKTEKHQNKLVEIDISLHCTRENK